MKAKENMGKNMGKNSDLKRYEKPALQVVHIVSEDVICASGDAIEYQGVEDEQEL